MDIKVKVKQSNPTHTHLTVFMNGINCGTLIMTGVEAHLFITQLERGSSRQTGRVIIEKVKA
jgi:hypothetical protein